VADRIDRHMIPRIILVMLGVFTASIGSGLARPSLAYYLRYNLGASLLATSSLTSSFMLGRTLGSVISGEVVSRVPTKRHLLVSSALLGASILLWAASFTHSPLIVLLLVALWGLAGGLSWPAVQVSVSNLAPDVSGTLLAVYFALGSLGIGVGNWFFGNLDITYQGMTRLGGLLLLSSIPFLLLSIRNLQLNTPRRKSRVTIRYRPLLAWIVLVAFAMGFTGGMLREYFYIYAKEGLGMARESLGNLLAAGSIFSAISALIMGAYVDKRGVPEALLILLSTTLLGVLILSNPHVAGIGYVLAIIGVRASLPQTRNASVAPSGRSGARLVGIANSSSSLGMMTGPLIAGSIGSLSKASLWAPFAVAGVLIGLILGSGLVIILLARTRIGWRGESRLTEG
jgi:MFS family permease